ncbi:DNA-binding transcriptional regulator, MarR family [Paraoerskovia marina]|uniref:DNA-binding transcriptional regulator, MarR family n=1 Tax=Paraoerskovia marina TaxID=545619 RepID=A0A1H1VKD1_9CELL|nr:MarR family transcriptional regulator [Paraoerskovia marina]SDS85252.1 DNA-binding transcriptional regulator, MarR family [Paraoerskovia marina]
MPEETTGEPRWLDADQQVQWRRYIEGASRLSEALARWHDEHLSVSLSEYEVLVRLSESPGHSMRMSRLADGLAYSRSRVTHTVRRLEAKGFVARSEAEGDRRGIECTLTPNGFETLEQEAPIHVEGVRRYMVDALDDAELESLGRAMASIARACREDE